MCKKKKILFISNQGISPLYLGIELEIIESLSSADNEIYFATCDRSTTSCYFNPTGNIIGCAICQSRNIKFHKLVENDNIKHTKFPKSKIDHLISDFDVNDTENINNWSYDSIPFGRGILSSVISLKRDYNVNQESLKPLIKEELKVALHSLMGFKELYDEIKPDVVYLYNGRFSEVFPIVSFCKTNNVQFYTYEIGSNYQTYELFRNNLPHSIKARQENMKKIWDEKDSKKIDLSQKWFEDKVKGKNEDDTVYIKNQIQLLLPDNFDETKINVGIFNSSEDEMKTIDEWQHSMYSTQNEAISLILNEFIGNNNYHFYLRNHPNLSQVNNSQTAEVKKFNFDNFTLIDASSPVDTYSLMKSCNVIISFGSTIGIEATYHGKISILLGKSFYTNLDVVYEPSSFEQLYDLLYNYKNLKPKPKFSTLSYGYYMAQRGEEYKYFNYKGKSDSSFKGQLINRFNVSTFSFLLKYFSGFVKYLQKFKILYGKWPSISDFKKLKI